MVKRLTMAPQHKTSSVAYWIIFHAFLTLMIFFSKLTFCITSFTNTIKMSNSFDPDLGPNCLSMLSADDTKVDKELIADKVMCCGCFKLKE